MNTKILGFIVANGPQVFKALLAIHNDKKLKEDLHVLSVNPSDMAAFVDFLREVSNDLGLVPVAPIGTPSPLSAP